MDRIKTVGVAALAAATLFTGCGSLNPDATLVTINTGDGTKDTISLGYGNFVARYQQSMYDQYLLSYYGEGMWTTDMSGTGSTFEDDTKESVLEEMEEQYLAKSHAADYDITLSEEQNTAIAEAAAKFIADNSKETLEELGATEEYVKEYLEYRTYYSLVSEAAKEASDADITDEACWMRTFSYVSFDTSGTTDEEGNAVEFTEDEITDMKAQAKQLSTSEDFDATVEELGLTAQTYSYLKGEEEDTGMDMSIIEAAEALGEGEISDVIEVDGVGFYVIRIDADHDEEASQTKRESLQTEAFDSLMETWKSAITWKVSDKAWSKVKFDALFQATQTEEAEDATTEDATTEDATTEDATEETTDETVEESAEEVTEEQTETEDVSEETTEEATDNTEAE